MQMKAAVLSGVRQKLTVETVTLDPPHAGEVLVQLVATGVCHSDVHVFTGDNVRRPFPIVLGHEGAGIVREVGLGVRDCKPGDHVVLTFLPACGKCRWCHTGQPNMCDLGAKIATGRMLDGSARLHRGDGGDLSNYLLVSTWAEYSVVPEASLVVVPDYLPLQRLCLLGCGFTTGFGAATNAVHIRPGETVTIVGCGGLGLSAVQGARMSGAGKIIAVDKYDEKLALAKRFGATHGIINHGDPDAVVREVMDITWGVGTDYSFEFVGWDQVAQTWPIAYHSARKGGTVTICGVGAGDISEVPISPWDVPHYRRLLQGVLFGDAQFRTDIPRYVRLFEEGRLELDGLVTHELRLEDINTAIENVLAGNRVGRQVIRFD
jgi:alcohol dehydrogenase (nicotinoprotein)